MLAYVIRRILLMIPTLIGMTFILFAVVRFAPGLTGSGAAGGSLNGGEGQMNSKGSREEMEQARLKRLHMVDANGRKIALPMQYIYWLNDSLHGNLGDSVQYHVPVIDLIRQRAPTTIALNLLSSFIIYLIAIPAGVLSAARRGKWFDVGWSVGTLALYSLPTIWIGNLLIGYFANPRNLGWFPSAGLHTIDTEMYTSTRYTMDYLWHLVLPLTCYVYGGFAMLSKQTRASILDNLGQDFARTARAKGLPAHVVILRHVFRNSLLPLITVFGGLLPGLLAGSVIIEEIFSIKGMGELYVTAADSRDLPVLQAVALIGSIISLISLLIADIAYAMADPRVSYD